MAEQLMMKLDPSGVANTLKRAVLVTTDTVGTCIRALAKDDLSPPELRAGSLGYRFDGLNVEGEARRALFHNWLFSKAFQDLARAVREMLEEAALYLAMIKVESGFTTGQRDRPVLQILKRPAGFGIDR